jgi:O-antigen/teichoic acid export membrane protein
MIDNGSPAKTDLTQRTIHGVFWSYLTFIGGMGLTSLTTILLARLLLPAEFGLVGYCLVAIQYLDILNTAGIDSALIARRENAEEAANAAFVANIVLGIFCYALTWFLAPSAAQFFSAPQVVPLLRVLGLSLPLSGLGLVPNTLLQRSLKFRKILISEISRNFFKGATSIVLAALGLGVWSLVWGQLAGILAGTTMGWVLAGWRPSWRFNAGANRAILFFGFHIILLEIAGAIRNNVDYLLVGRILGAAALGFYTLSYRIPELLIRSLNSVVGDVSLPGLAIAGAEPGVLRGFYFGYLRYIAMFVLPMGAGLALTAPIFVPLFLSATWTPAIVPTSLISLALGIGALGYVPGVLYKAIGRPDMLNRLALIKMPLAISILWYATRWNIVGVALAQIAVSLISVSMDMLIANYLLHFPIRAMSSALLPAFISTIAMAIAVFVVRTAFAWHPALSLAVMVMVGTSVYVGVLWAISREALLNAAGAVQQAFRKKARRAVVLETTINE